MRGRVERFWPLFLPPVLWFLAAPAGEFPLNDDWAYASAVRHLWEEGRLRLSDWATPFHLPAVLTAAVPAALLGFSHTLLRVLTVLWGALGMWILDRWLSEEGVVFSDRLLTCCALLFCPLVFVVLFSFHTEIPYITICLGALYCFRRSDREGVLSWDAAGGFLTAFAFLTRQTGAALLLGQTLWILGGKGPAPFKRLALLWAPPVVLGGGFLLWFWNIHGPTWAFVNYFLHGTAAHVAGEGLMGAVGFRAAGCFLMAALFASPLLPYRAEGKGPLWIFLCALPFALFLRAGGLPFFGNFWHPLGLGPLTGVDGWAKPVAALWSSPLLWAGLGVAGAAAAGSFLAAVPRLVVSRAARHVVILWAPLALATLPGEKFFDRYVIAWIPLLLFPAVLAGVRASSFRWALLAFWAAVSVVGTRDYFAWNRAKWVLGRKALTRGFAREEVANGVDWAADGYYERRMAELRWGHSLGEIGEMEWKRGPFPRVFITFDPSLYPASRLLAVRRYASPLAPRGALFMYRSDAS